jgi:hypothetical protein
LSSSGEVVDFDRPEIPAAHREFLGHFALDHGHRLGEQRPQGPRTEEHSEAHADQDAGDPGKERTL